ncbi:hypothetical protein ISF_03372 [Cordyceps fumosorosea ARSEF 2679]|uniref:Uncharacterized protein n=1 Tax=Cordyceps fumosorosea (strain ARSEF 2679) TaxID=1081104 RepID=A0A168ANZ9_CORFA|nr:hypothetical protein ISF_03372 [Cordyceps fumosorosea ARSEF 2679]OAA68997.1 hypothetical protein ISF_03372 [Cordyceps fumosorosea ARSEF 2679]
MATRQPRASSGSHNTKSCHLLDTPVQINDSLTYCTSHNSNKRPRTAEDASEHTADYFEAIRQVKDEDDFSIGLSLQEQTQSQHQQDSHLDQLQLELQFQQRYQSQFHQLPQYDDCLPDGSELIPSLPPEVRQGEEQFPYPFLTYHTLQQPSPSELVSVSSTSLSPSFSSPGYYETATTATPADISSPQVIFHSTAATATAELHIQSLPLPAQAALPLPSPPQQPEIPQQPIDQSKPHLRPAMTTTTEEAAAALSKSSSEATSEWARRVNEFYSSCTSTSSSSSSAHAGMPPPPLPLSMLRIGGYTLEEAGVTLPEDLSPAERDRRLCLLAQELHYEVRHPPVLPPSRVPELPEKTPPSPLPRVQPGMNQAQRDAITHEVARLAAAQRKADQERNNLAAKKSRLLRLECLDNTRLQLNAKAAECAWLRLQIVALLGVPLPRRPSEAWGGSDFVYQTPERRWEADEEGEVDVEGVVPTRIKRAITEEIRARVEAHREALEEEHKRRTTASRSLRRSEAQAQARAAEVQADEEEDHRQWQYQQQLLRRRNRDSL